MIEAYQNVYSSIAPQLENRSRTKRERLVVNCADKQASDESGSETDGSGENSVL